MLKFFNNQNYTLEVKKSKLHNIVLEEVVDINVLDKLIKSDLLRLDFHNPQAQTQWENEKQQLLEYRKKISNDGVATIRYVKARGIKWGRVHPENAIGLFSLRRELRQTLAKPNYIDIDIENAYPKFITEIFKDYKDKLPRIFEYVENREKVLSDVMKNYSVSREEAKKLFLILLHFGGFDGWYDAIMTERYKRKLEEEIEENDKIEKLKKIKQRILEDKKSIKFDDWMRENNYNNKKENKFISEFKKERNSIGETIIDHNPELKEAYSKRVNYYKKLKMDEKKNEKGGIVAYFLQEIECQILETIYDYCIKKKYILKGKDAVLCYDGIMINKKLYKEGMTDEFHKLIFDTFGIDLRFSVKEMTQDYLDIIDSHIKSEDDLRKEDELKYNDDEFWKSLEMICHSDMAELYYKHNKDKYIYEEVKGSGWYSYKPNNVIYHNDMTPTALHNNISKELQNLFKEYEKRLNPADKEYLKKQKLYVSAYKKTGSAEFIGGIVKYLRDMYKVDRLQDKFDSNINLLCFDNYIYDLSIRQFRDIRRDDYITKTTRYNIDTTVNDDIRQEILTVLMDCFQTEEEVDYFLLITALSLFGNKKQSFFINTGKGGNGKGLFSNILEKSLGDYFLEVQHTFLTSKKEDNKANSDLYKAKGVRVVNVTEPEGCKITDEIQLNTEFVKKITGGDTVVARDLYKSTISYKPQFTPFLQCNNMPKMKRVEGMERRTSVIPWKFNFVSGKPNIKLFQKKRDTTLVDKFNRIEYANQYMLLLLDRIRNYNNEEIVAPLSFQENTNDYIESSNVIKNFIKDNCLTNMHDVDKLCNIMKYDATTIQGKKEKFNYLPKTAIKETYNNNAFTKLNSTEFNALLAKCNVVVVKHNGKDHIKNILMMTPNEVEAFKQADEDFGGDEDLVDEE